ncbi:thiF family protein [Firmicutes bacterium CAG:884]|nr:thiF family protein [Firmicutes bacterium CAG:884]
MFERVELLLEEKINKLKDKTILVLGVGGVGSYTVETLIRNPIKKIIIIDADVVDITNLNRQLFTNQNNIGLKKVDELEKRIKSINPYIEIKKIDKFIDENNIQLLFEEKVDYIVDACDSIKTKEILIKECLERKIKFISCMGTAKKLDPTKLEITDIRKTSYDPLAKRIRKMVKDEKINGKIPVICSTEKPQEIKKLGSISFVPSVAGIYITSYIINDIIGEK